MANDQVRTSTSTQIRNFYSDDMSYMNVSFFNTNLSLKLYPFLSKDNLGKSTYDMKNGQVTTIDYEGAAALYKVADDIIEGKISEVSLPIPCASGATIEIERKLSSNGIMETYLNLTKNNIKISFRFKTRIMQVKENGQIVQKTIESGLEAFKKTLEGYLTGINADRHLNKLTDDFIKAQESNGGQQNNNGNNNYRNNNYRKPYNGNNGYRKPYNNNNNGNGNYNGNNSNNWNPPKQQDMSSYTINN